MQTRIEFPSNGHDCHGYLSTSATPGPAVIVIQEWWGLVPHIEDVCDRLAASGFSALAPDLYHGTTARTPDDARKQMMELEVPAAVEEIRSAARWLLASEHATGSVYGVVGFCMGGGLALQIATSDEKVGAAVSFYGAFAKVKPDWQRLTAPLLLVYAGLDNSLPPSHGVELQKQLRAAGKDVDLAVYPESHHGFFNDTRPEVYDEEAADDAWRRTIELFRMSLPGGAIEV